MRANNPGTVLFAPFPLPCDSFGRERESPLVVTQEVLCGIVIYSFIFDVVLIKLSRAKLRNSVNHFGKPFYAIE